VPLIRLEIKGTTFLLCKWSSILIDAPFFNLKSEPVADHLRDRDAGAESKHGSCAQEKPHFYAWHTYLHGLPGAQNDTRNYADVGRHDRWTGPMIVCSCSLITAKEVADAVEAIRVADPSGKLKMDRIFRLLGTRPSCGGCGRLIKELVASYERGGPTPHKPRSFTESYGTHAVAA
jgi:bacterioferritin-associated ferredoxin